MAVDGRRGDYTLVAHISSSIRGSDHCLGNRVKVVGVVAITSRDGCGWKER